MQPISVTGLGLVILLAGIVVAQGAQQSSDTLGQVKARVRAKQAVLIDVRERGEWDRGHLQGAFLMPLSVLFEWQRDGISPAQRAQLDKAIPHGTILYCHCASGGRAISAGEILRGLGYDARALREGYRDLLAAGFPRSQK
ncbi:MAG: rhodanese-like domain-containing protein [Isosphaeraceae bacterium]